MKSRKKRINFKTFAEFENYKKRTSKEETGFI